MDSREEKELVKKAQADPEAFGRLYDEYYPKIFGYVLRRTASLEMTQDVVAETFLKALKNLPRFKWIGLFKNNSSFGAWLYRIAANEIVNFWRQKKPSLPLDDVREPESGGNLLEEISLAQEKLERHQDFLAVQREIQSLPEKYQAVLTLRFFEEKQIKEIAEILDKNEGTVKSLLHRGLKRLRDRLPPAEH
ncbi:MAG: RNA polymerase sigma factor [Candidatus Nealsonbacteria bacterium]|nr:RNA polymerase sigma factor [Candidatus Nealsonbacteria bacterium]